MRERVVITVVITTAGFRIVSVSRYGVLFQRSETVARTTYEMYQILNHKLIITVLCGLMSSQCEGNDYNILWASNPYACMIIGIGTSITLSPSGMTSVCPGGQVLLTCKRKPPSSILYWNVSVLHLDTTLERIVLSRGSLLSPRFRINFTEFNITRTSESPFISQLLISNMTTEITVFCSEDGNETNAPMIVIYKGVFVNNNYC